MKPRAILSFLWIKNIDVLARFLTSHPDITVLSSSGWTEVQLSTLQARFGDRVIDINALLQPGDQLELDIFARDVQAAAVGLTSDLGCARFCREMDLDVERFVEVVTALGVEQFPWIARLVILLRKAAQIFDIGLVVLNEDITLLGRTVADWARARGIPSMVLTHGVLLSGHYTVHKALNADVAAVFGERGAETYLDIGVHPERVRVTGNPAWDVYATQKRSKTEIKKLVCQQAQLDPFKPLVVFATTWAAALTAHCDVSIYQDTLRDFLQAMRRVRDQGIPVQVIVKDRAANSHFGQAQTEALLNELGFTQADARYTTDQPEPWVLAADVLVAVDSNISIEAMIAETPSVNLLNDMGLVVGPSFDADSGVFEVSPLELSEVVSQLLTDAEFSANAIATAKKRLGYYNAGVDGHAGERVANFMSQLLKFSDASNLPVWQRYLDVPEIDATGYHSHARSELFDTALHPPRVMLDIGCAAGATGAWVKQQYPGAVVYGIELNRAAAKVASQLLDRVWVGKFEEIDFEKEGIAKGSIDTVVVADVLEHMYNPWQVLASLKPYLSENAQILASIPNVRNLVLMRDLAAGYWRYESEGLLDVTHIRFFTLKEVKRFFYETGFRVETVRCALDPRLIDFWNQNAGKEQLDIELGRMVLKDVSAEELQELCALQFFCVAVPGAMERDVHEYESNKKEAPITNDYLQWLERLQLTKPEANLYDKRYADFGGMPGVHLLVYLPENSSEEKLSITVKSLTNLLYDSLRVTVLSSLPPPQGLNQSERFMWATYSGNPLLAANAVLNKDETSAWFGCLFAGDELEPHSLLMMVERGQTHPDWQLLYSDEDLIIANGQYDKPRFKPDLNLDLLRSVPYLGGLLLIRSYAFHQLEGFDARWLGAEEYDLALRCLEQFSLDAIGHVAEVLLHRQRATNAWQIDENELNGYYLQALQTHLQRLELPAQVSTGSMLNSFKVEYGVSDASLISILIPVCDDIERLRRCIESIWEKTDYANFEILLAQNASQETTSHEFFEQLNQIADARVRTFKIDAEVGLAAIFNSLASHARGEFFVFMHHDSAVLEPNWLSHLLGIAQRNEVGSVSPRMVDSRYRIRGTGYIAGMNGPAQVLFVESLLDTEGYGGRAQLQQNFSALPMGCLMVRRSIFQAAGGFDEDELPHDLYDFDFGMRLTAAGLLNVWTPHVSVLSEGEAPAQQWTLLRDKPEKRAELVQKAEEVLYQRWLPDMARDPAYNQNLRLMGEPFKIDMRQILPRNATPWNPLPRLAVLPADLQGCGHYRIMSPARHLTKAIKAQALITLEHYQPSELARLEVQSMVMQRQLLPHQHEFIRRYKKYNRDTLLVFELDDLFTNVPVKSLHRRDLPKNIMGVLKESVGLCDRLVVSTEPIAQAYKDLTDDIRVVKNRIEHSIWGEFRPQRRISKRPRIGWAGGIGHSGDLQMIADVVKETANEVEWVFLGMFPEGTRAYISEFHEGVQLKDYPAKLASLNLDLALAPLEMIPFNEAKSNLRLLEFGILGYPVICTDIFPYQDPAFPVTRVKNSTANWVNAIREHISDMDATAKMGDQLRQYILNNWLLEDHLDEWLAGWLR